jgi:hypothetical protein
MSLQTRKTDVFGALCNSSHLYDQTVPETECGLVSIVPPGSTLPKSTQIIECDGYSVHREGKWLPLQAGHDLIVDAYAEAARALPFRANGCFLSVVEAAPNAYLAYLIDPEERFPVGVHTELELNLDGDFICSDALTRQAMSVRNRKVPVEIPIILPVSWTSG